jgi:1-acyl-sn-glycerol-3-phosphate acyltransferase
MSVWRYGSGWAGDAGSSVEPSLSIQSTTAAPVRIFRLARLLIHVLLGVVTAALVLPWVAAPTKRSIIRSWSRTINRILALECVVRGEAPAPAAQGIMFVANHVSWLDIYVLNAVCTVRFISKAEVRSWPIVGWLASKTGTLFIERARRRDTARINSEVAQALRDGDNVAFFPEGTTTDGTHLRPFHTSLLQSAIDADVPVCPVALRYVLGNGGVDQAPAYVDQMSFGESLRRILGRKSIRVELTYLHALPTRGRRRTELAHEAEIAIASALSLPAPHRIPGTPHGLPA